MNEAFLKTLQTRVGGRPLNKELFYRVENTFRQRYTKQGKMTSSDFPKADLLSTLLLL